jgi:hypothetical protein
MVGLGGLEPPTSPFISSSSTGISGMTGVDDARTKHEMFLRAQTPLADEIYLMPEPIPRRFAECICLVLPQHSSAFPIIRLGRLPACFREHDFPRVGFRGCSYSVMFRPPSLLASQIVPTAASSPAGQPRLLDPSRTCVVTFARIGHAIRPTTGNWRNENFHLARFAALSAATE